jgi:hypothetical protein
VRRADHAGRHTAELVCHGPPARPHGARALAGDVAEGAPERAQALPARLEGDLGDRQVGVAQQCGRPLDAPREQVAVRRHAEGLLERSREVGRGDAAHARQPWHRPGFVRGGVHAVFCAQQAAQQLGVLACRTLVHAGFGCTHTPIVGHGLHPAACPHAATLARRRGGLEARYCATSGRHTPHRSSLRQRSCAR